MTLTCDIDEISILFFNLSNFPTKCDICNESTFVRAYTQFSYCCRDHDEDAICGFLPTAYCDKCKKEKDLNN